MQLGFTKKQLVHVLKVALYIGISSAIGFLISYTTDNPNVWGPATAFVNLLLVSIQQFIKAPEE